MAEVRENGVTISWLVNDKLQKEESYERSLLSYAISPRVKLSHAIQKTEDWLKYIEEGNEFYMEAKEAIEFAKKKLMELSEVPPHGFIIYAGSVYTDDGKKDIAIAFEPFKLIFCPFNRIYYKFETSALTSLLEPEPKPEYGLVERYKQERSLLYEFFDEKKSVYGVDTWKRLGDVKVLFVWEKLDINCCRVKNPKTSEVVTMYLNKEQENEKIQSQGLEILEKAPLLDWLAQVHKDKLFGCKIVFVGHTFDEDLKSKFCKEYGGIGGILGDQVNIQAHGWVQSFVSAFGWIGGIAFGWIGGILGHQVNIQAHDG